MGRTGDVTALMCVEAEARLLDAGSFAAFAHAPAAAVRVPTRDDAAARRRRRAWTPPCPATPLLMAALLITPPRPSPVGRPDPKLSGASIPKLVASKLVASKLVASKLVALKLVASTASAVCPS